MDPKKEYIFIPSDFGIEFNEICVDFDNYSLFIWDSCPKNPIEDKTILLAYGDFGNMSYYINYVKLYTDLGYRVITFDYRGFGKSSDFKINRKVLYHEEFVTDFDNVIYYCKNKLGVNNITVVSLSMGTLITSLSNEKNYIESIIAEGAVFDSNHILERLKEKKLQLPQNYKNTIKGWEEFEVKILIFAGTLDNVTTIGDAHNIVNQNNYNRRLVEYNGTHLSILNKECNRRKYFEMVKQFLNDE